LWGACGAAAAVAGGAGAGPAAAAMPVAAVPVPVAAVEGAGVGPAATRLVRAISSSRRCDSATDADLRSVAGLLCVGRESVGREIA